MLTSSSPSIKPETMPAFTAGATAVAAGESDQMSIMAAAMTCFLPAVECVWPHCETLQRGRHGRKKHGLREGGGGGGVRGRNVMRLQSEICSKNVQIYNACGSLGRTCSSRREGLPVTLWYRISSAKDDD
jgi:hypothetical protein